MPTLTELRELQDRAFREADLARKASDWSKAKQYLDEIETRSVEIQSAVDAESRFKSLKGEWDTPVQDVPLTSVEQRDMKLNDEERGWRTDANFKPRGWAYDMETREALGPAIQPIWVRRRMGKNLQEQARQYTETFEKWLRAKTETRGINAFFQNASADEVNLMKAHHDKTEGGYYIPDEMRASSARGHWPGVRAMGETTDTAGGFFVPEDFQTTVLHDPGVPGGIIRPRARVITTSLRDGYFPTIGSVSWTAMQEAATYTDNSPNVGQVSFTVRKSGGQVLISTELLEDTAISLPPLLSQIFMEAKGHFEDQKIIAGDGVNEPEGLRTALGSSQTFTLAGSTAITAADVIGAYWSIPAQFRDGASWYLTSTLMQQIMSIGSTSAGIHFGGGADNVDLRVAPDKVLFGKEIALFDGTGWDDAAAIATGEVLGAIGNFKNYYLIDRVGMSLKRDDSINVKTDQVWYGARMRMDGRVGILNAFRLIKAA